MSRTKEERIPPRAHVPKGNGFVWISFGRRSRRATGSKHC
jgi:hypothetical protein